MKYLRGESVEVIIYETTLADGSDFNGFEVENDFAKFSKRSDIIIANRLENELKKVSDKVYTRDLFARDQHAHAAIHCALINSYNRKSKETSTISWRLSEEIP